MTCPAHEVGDRRFTRITPVFNRVRQNEILGENGHHEICRPLRGLSNSCALIPGARPGLYDVRTLRALSNTFPKLGESTM